VPLRSGEMEKTMKRADAKELLIRTVETLVQNKTIERIKIHDIANESGLTRQTFYHYFPDKYAVIQEIYLQDLKLAMRQFSDNKISCCDTLECLFAAMRKKQAYYKNAIKSKEQNSLGEFMVQFLFYFHSTLLRLSQSVNVLDDNLLPLIRFWGYGAANYILYWIAEDMQISDRELAMFLWSTIPDRIRISPEEISPAHWKRILNDLDSAYMN
jgi:AcrR family transcriptional regulator